MDRILTKLFDTNFVDINLVKLIREFSDGDHIDEFVRNIIRNSTNHEKLFGIVFRFKLGTHNCKVVSSFDFENIKLVFTARKFQQVGCKMPCKRGELLDFDAWVEKQNMYYDMCETFLRFLIQRYKDGLLKCTACGKFHWCESLHTCRTCLKVFNDTPCPKCLSYFGTRCKMVE